MYRCRNSVKKVCDWKKTFDIDSSESEYTSVSNGDVTFIKEQNTPTRIYSEEDGSGKATTWDISHLNVEMSEISDVFIYYAVRNFESFHIICQKFWYYKYQH